MSLKQNIRRGQTLQASREVKEETGPREKRIHADVPAGHHKAFLVQLMHDELQMKDVVHVLTEFYLRDEDLRERVRRELRVS